MLKFWKNSARGKSRSCPRPPENVDDNVVQSQRRLSNNIIEELSDSLVTHPVVWESVVLADGDGDITSHTSRLSKTLEEILKDRHSLSYLRQYLDSISLSNLIEFWIQAENFHTASKIFSDGKSKLYNKEKSVNHSVISRTVSFDSSIIKHKYDDNHIISKLNGYSHVPLYNSEMKAINNWRKCGQISESCSSIREDEWSNTIPEFKSKEDLVNEAVRIFKQFIALESPQKLDLPDEIRNSTISAICHPEGHIDPDIFRNVQNLVKQEIQNKHYDNFLQTEYCCKYQIDVLTSGTLTIEDIIFNQMALFYFTEYLEQENMSIVLEFVLAVLNFRDQLNTTENYDPEQVQNDAIILYDKYFSLQATSPLGFNDDIRLETEENICREGGPVSNCFHQPFRLALAVLQQYISLFTSSNLYYKYLSEMISSVENCWNTTRRKKSYSDCSSEISISARNTLLAMEDNSSRIRRQSKDKTNMRIDSKLLYNGDLLWRRKTDKGLCLGRINSLGRFESSMEPDPEKKDSSVIKRVVNRLVSGEKEKAKEELAWQVAHMIVKDITDVTMGMSDNSL